MSDGKILTGLSFEEYSQIPAVNYSTLRMMGVSPLHYQDAVENGGIVRPAFALGSAAHTAILEPEEWLRRYIIKPDYVERADKKTGELVRVQLKKDERQAEWVELSTRAKREKKAIITEKENALATKIARRVLLDPVASKLLRGKVSTEVTVQWTHASTGILLRSRLDLVNHTLGRIVDVKTTANIRPDRWFHQAAKLGYLAQFAMYADAWHAATGESLPFSALPIEKERPHDMFVCPIPEEDLEHGRATYETWLQELARCRDKGEFPGVAGGEEMPFVRPDWDFPEEDDEITTENAA
jgi:hypothetical protein